MHGRYLYIIDGHNLIPKVNGLSLKMEDDELELVKRLQTFARVKRASVEVFFDQGQVGNSGSKHSGMVITHFVKKGVTADHEIIVRMQTLKKQSQAVTIVTSDHQIITEAHALRFKIIKSEEFSQILAQSMMDEQKGSGQNTRPLSADELDEWLKLFGEND